MDGGIQMAGFFFFACSITSYVEFLKLTFGWFVKL